jgi:monothiol glutaredoxin
MSDPYFDQIQKQIDDNDVVLFMKGTATFPQCGFSAALVQVLSSYEVDFKDVNVLDDNELREKIKEFTNWPTIPQLYVKGEFIGGCDIVREMYESGELEKLLENKNISYRKAA